MDYVFGKTAYWIDRNGNIRGKGKTNTHRETTGPDGGEFFSYSPFDPWAGSGSSSTNSLGSGLGGRSGGGGSNGGGDSNPSSSSNSENGENYWDDATWIQPPRQQSINLSNPNLAAANGGDGSEVFRAIFTGVAITTEAGNALSRFNSNELKKLQKILETNHNVNSIKINNQLLKVARNGNIIKGIGFVGNVANLGAIGFDIIEHGGNITTENALDATFGVVAFVPTVGWVISSAYSLNKEASKTGYYFSGDMIMW